MLNISTSVFSDELNVQKLLSSMSESVRTLNYQGRFMYVVGGEMSSFEVQHALINKKEHERLVFLNQKQQEVVRVGHDVFCVHPGNHLLRDHQNLTTNPFSEKLSKLSKGIDDSYDISIEKNQMIAGRDTYKVSFKSKDTNRYDHYLWIDKQSHLLLKADISDPDLGILESFEYIQVEIGKEIPLKTFEHKNFVQHTPKHFEPKELFEADSISSKSKSIWRASWLPEGFYFSGENEQEITSGDEEETSSKVSMLMYTDGIAAITVFIEAMDKVSRFSESSQKGAVSAYSHTFKINGRSEERRVGKE